MEYILQNVPEYTEAKNQLEIKAQKWKQEIEVKKNEVTKRKESLKTEQVLTITAYKTSPFLTFDVTLFLDLIC